MADAYIIDAVRTPSGRRNGGLSQVHPADLGAHVITSLDQGVIHSPELHGLVRTAYTNYFWDKAWLER